MLIGLLGRKGAGKDTVADYICNTYGFQKMALADPLKEACRILFNFNDEQLYGNQKEVIDPNWNITPRHVLQFIGTEVFRDKINEIIPEIGDNFWVHSLLTRYYQRQLNTIISDVRFSNEIEEIKKAGGIIIKIVRPSNNNIKDAHSSHVSEIEIDNLSGDYEIINCGTIEELFQKMNDILIRVIYNQEEV